MKMSHITFYLAQSVTEKLYNAYCNSTLSCGSAYFDYEYLSIMDSSLSSCVISYVSSQTYKCSKVARASSACSGRLHKMNWCNTDIKGHIFFTTSTFSLYTSTPSLFCMSFEAHKHSWNALRAVMWLDHDRAPLQKHWLLSERATLAGFIWCLWCSILQHGVFSSVTVFV